MRGSDELSRERKCEKGRVSGDKRVKLRKVKGEKGYMRGKREVLQVVINVNMLTNMTALHIQNTYFEFEMQSYLLAYLTYSHRYTWPIYFTCFCLTYS